MAEPKVALVHDHLVQDGGAERVLRTLMKMYPEAPVYTAFFDPAKMGPDFAGRDIRTSFLDKIPGMRKHYKWSLSLLDFAFRRFDLSGYDLVISSASAWAKSVRTKPKTRHICYCHTPTRYIWSDAESYIRNTGYPRIVQWGFFRLLGWLRRNDLRAAAGVDNFVANSAYVAERIKQYYDRPSVIVHPPVDISQFAPSAQTKDYFLVATRLEPYKRVDLAISVFNDLKLPLKIMGAGTEKERLQKLAGPTVSFTGRVSDAERRALFAEAQAFINPQDEDFGITVVEALASGTPVIAYGKGGATEILNEDTGVLFSPQTAQALALAVRGFDRKKFDPRKLRQRAEDFSEERFQQQLAAVIADGE